MPTLHDLLRTAHDVLDFVPLAEGARLPVRRFPTDGGIDLFSLGPHTLGPGEVRLIDTGVGVAIPPGFYGQIAGRSGLAVRGIWCHGGVIDSGYRKSIGVVLHNMTREARTVGDLGEDGEPKGIAQLLVLPCLLIPARWAAELPASERGANGFGSTDSRRAVRYPDGEPTP